MTQDPDHWRLMPLLAFDTETTSPDPLEARIVTATAIRITHTSRPQIWRWITDPGIPIPDEAAAIHGYTTERAKAEATHTPEQLLFELTGQIALALGRGIPVAAMNAAYDFTTLEAENTRHGIDTLTARLGAGRIQPILDPYVLDKHADRYRKGGRKLEQLCATYGIPHTGAHDAVADALAAARLVPKILDHPKHARKFRGFTLPALHQAQIGWRREQMDGLRDYFDKQGTEHDGCDPGWPIYHTWHNRNREETHR